ncbi:type II secretion system F family protein [Nocardioides sp. SYSU D00038]|uniref:type II secretion system F family protein n=1 Tax=Nocardioides sp. SYSU D00038 TaxID=2812554 RepID=UPI0019677547|nr:type II secretion system F family protein [Nocardioides sp. SYSU D00038]
MTPWLTALAVAGAVALALPPGPSTPSPPVATSVAAAPGWMLRWRWVWSASAGLAVATFLGGTAGWVGGAAVVPLAWHLIGRVEPPDVRRRREQVRVDLPHVVGLLADAVRAGRPPGEALELVVEAFPGAAADRLAPLGARLALGADPAQVWGGLADHAELAPLGRALARAHTTGGSVVATIERLAVELAASARADTEDRARRVGVQAAVPLGLCLLPAFVLVGIVPVAAGLLESLTW